MRLLRTTRVVLIAAIAVGIALSKFAQPSAHAAPPPSGTNGKIDPLGEAAPQPCKIDQTRSGWRVQLANGHLLFDRWNPLTAGPSSLLAPSSVEVTPTSDGLSVVYTFTNKSSRPMRLVDLDLPVMEIAPAPLFMDASFLGTAAPIPSTPTAWMGGVYPRDLYSPVTALVWKGGAVGISLIYPVLEYRHDAAIVIRKVAPGKWKPMIGLNNGQIGDHWSTVLKYEATVPPGGQRIYRVEIRATTKQSWLDTLEPYRDYFKSTYGTVRYTRDGRSIAAVQTAMDDRQSDSNPDGWIAEVGRPDLNGYGTVVAMLRQALVKYERAILWSPTGLYRNNASRNYPFKFVSRWFDPRASTQFRNAPSALASVGSRSGREWGLWWGRAAETQSDWDSPAFTPIALASEETVKLARRELGLAVSTGARIIGLDAFTHHHSPVWELHPWLRRMTLEHPGVVFCTEGRNPDIMHALAPTWVDAFGTTKYRASNAALIGSRFVLADWLLPKHETWAGMLWNRADREDLRTQPGGPARRAEIDRIRSLGFVPVLFGD